MLKNKKIIDKLTLMQKAALTSGQTTWESVSIADEVPQIFMSDGPHGLRKQTGAADHLGLNGSEPATCFPTAATLANSWDESLLTKVGHALGDEARKLDVQMVLGPGLNIKRNPRGGRNFEYFSEDPLLAGKMGAAIIRGIQSTGTIAAPKHFAANNQEYRRMASNSVIDARTFRELYLTNFEIAIKEGHAKAIMSSYNQVNGTYANENKLMLTSILRQEWGFDGFVVTDWGGDNNHPLAIANGSNLAMPTLGVSGIKAVVAAVKDGELSEADLDQRVDEFLTVVLNSTAGQNQNRVIDWDKQHQIAHEAATKSIVLLKNDQHILPLQAAQQVAIIGDFAKTPRYQGSGSSMVNAKQVETILDCLPDYDINVSGFAQGYTRQAKVDHSLVAEAVILAKKSDVAVIFAGLDEASETEARDRPDLKMPFNQVDLINKVVQSGTPVVVVLSAGAVVEMPWLKGVHAVVHGYLGGEAGASAMLEALTGGYNPSGKLAESYPITYDEVPFGDDFPATGRNVFYKEGPFVGYRYYEKAHKRVLFPFGFGLSYTTFAYRDLKVTDDGITVTVKNTGSTGGAEVVQLYVGKPDSNLIRPAKELKAFAKVDLAVGEQQTVQLKFDDKTFRFFDQATQQWQVEAGTYQLSVGASLTDIRLQAQITRSGITVAANQRLKPYQNADLAAITMADFEALYDGKLPIVSHQVGHRIEIERNSTIAELSHAKNWLARLVARYLRSALQRSQKKNQPDLNLLFIYNMPLRAIGKMSNGQFSDEMLVALLRMVNGHFFGGLVKLVQAYFVNQRETRQLEV